MDALFLSTAVIFVAELGDKSQLMALAFASRYPGWFGTVRRPTFTHRRRLSRVAASSAFTRASRRGIVLRRGFPRF